MGRERQKKKNRSSLQKVKPKLRDRTKAGKKKVNFLGNEIIAKNWDRKLTMSQNYNRLGLSSRLNAATGGVERKANEDLNTDGTNEDSLSVKPRNTTGKILLQETQVERDPDTGHILRIIRPEQNSLGYNALNDPLNELEDRVESPPTTSEKKGVVGELEAQVEEEARQLAKTKKPRQQSQRESEWIESLVQRHGENIMAMVRDRRLNPMQQSEGDIRRRVKLWTASRHSTDAMV